MLLKEFFNFNKNSKLEVAITYNNDDNDANDSAENEIYDIVDGGEKAKIFANISLSISKRQ